MIKIEHVETFGWESAIRGMRNPMNSWDKSDSYPLLLQLIDEHDFEENKAAGLVPKAAVYHSDAPSEGCDFIVGEADLKLMKQLSKAGSDHGKFLRMINVTMDTTAPLYWWKEFDTYKVGTVANSCSTMHKIHAKEFTLDDFSHEHLTPRAIGLLEDVIDALNIHREQFLECTMSKYISPEDCEEAKKQYWWQMIQLLPSSYNQKRTVQLNYQVLKAMHHSRKEHKLDEWRTFCDEMHYLPYFEEICLNG